MPISYLEGNPQDVYAIQRAGSTFSDALLGMQQNRMRQQQIANQQALDAAYFQLQQRKAQQESQMAPLLQQQVGAETALAAARTGDLKMRADESTKAMALAQGMGQDISMLYDPAIDPMSESFLQGDVAGRGAQIAAMQSPANLAMQAAQFIQSRNPMMQQAIASRDAFPVLRPGEQMYSMAGMQPGMTNAPMAAVPTASRYSPQDDANERTRTLAQALAVIAKARSEGANVGPAMQPTVDQYLRSIGVTNAPTASLQPQGPQRKMGETVTTSKGTFRWVGNGWEPVSQ